jgi:hypothetical protein
MKLKIKRVFLVSAICVIASTALAQKPGLLSGERFDYDQATGNTHVSKARIMDEGLVLTAGNASYTVDENETPRSIELTGGVKFQIGNNIGAADRAVYYPELQVLSSRRVSLLSDTTVTYSCQSGTLYANGTSTGSSSTCVGFLQIGCGGSAGNTLTITRLKYACSGG